MNPQQAKELLEKYRLGLCTEEEKNAIEDWFNSLNEEGSWQWSDDERIMFKEQLKKRIDKEITDEQQTSVSTMRTRFLKYVAAASLLAVIATGAYFAFNRSTKGKENVLAKTTQSFKNDVKPGTDGAILILADGRQVMLDSSGNTVPIQDGNVQLTNKDGKLTYSVSDEEQAGGVLSYNTVQTPRARQYKLHLSDGTDVWLNAASSIRYPVVFGKKERIVEITGEVYFEVAKLVDETNKRQPVPFTVHIEKASGDAGEVQVLGTHFNINAYDDEDDIKTTLVEGKVKVKKQQAEVLLLPGNQAKMDKNGKFTVVKDADITNVMAWKNGLFSFDNAGVQVVMNQLARWYDIDVEYAGGKIPNDHFWGDIQRNARLSTVLKMLEISGVKFTLEGNKVTVLK